jgi:hypothetical protein
MKAKLINELGEKTYAVVFDKGDEVVEGLLSFAHQETNWGNKLTNWGHFPYFLPGDGIHKEVGGSKLLHA